MALEVGRLVARIDIEGSFEEKLAKLRSSFEETAKAAEDLDKRVSNLGKTKVDFPDAPKKKMDDAAASASKLDDNVKKASASGKNLDVSDTARRKLDDTASSAGRTASSLDKASASGKNLRVSDQPKVKLAETASVADQVDAKLGKLGVSMKTIVGAAGAGAGLGAVVMKGWDRITAIDTAQGKLRGLGHEAEGVSTIMSSALDSVTGTSYGLGDAATIAANAVAAGIQPGKDLTKYLTMTADASAIAGVSLGEMGRILNQVQTGQSAYAGDLSQLADRGIPIYQWLADEAGVAATEVKKMASEGKVSSEMLFSAIQNNISGAAQELGGTLVGSLANVGAAFGRLGASAIDPFKDDIMAAAEGAQEFAGTLASVVGPAASVAASGLGLVADVVGTIPTPILAATAGLVALQKTGLGASMAGAASTAVGALRGVGETMALGGMYARDNIKANGLFAASMDGIKGAAGGLRTGLGNVVDMLGGPWMIGLAGATIAVTDIIGSVKRASEAQGAISESAARAASAHRDLALAVGEANGAMSEQAVAAAQSIIEEKINATGVAAEQASGMFAGLGNWIDQTTQGYDGMKSAIDGNVSALDRSRLEGRVSEMQMDALREAAGNLSIEMDDVSAVVQRGGPRWNELRAALESVGPAGVDMANKLQEAADAANRTAEAARNAEPGSIALAEAFRVMADEASSAADKAAALDAALVALAGPTYEADEAMANYWATARKTNEALDGLVSSGENMINVMDDGTLAFDLQTESGAGLREMFKDMRKATVDTVASAGDLGAVAEENSRKMQALSEATGFTVPQLEKLAETAGFFKDPIELAMKMTGGDEAAAEIAMVSQQLKGVEEGAKINVGVISGDAVKALDELGFKVTTLENGSVEITAKTEEARQGIENVATAVGGLDGKTATAILDAEAASANNKITAIFSELAALDEAEANPELGLIIDQFMQGRDISHADLDALHARIVDPQARLLIEQLLAESARANTDLDNTARPRTAVITPQLASGSLGSIQSALNSMSFSVPVRPLPSMDFAIGGIRSFADGGTMLPDQARIERPHGAAGLVQWAEAETGGEAYIPLAQSKRRRSSKILSRVADMFGYTMLTGAGEVASFANGGVVEGMTSLVGKKFPALKATSTYRNSNDHHGGGKAVDFSNGYDNTPEQLALANYIADNFPDSLELIYSHPGFNRNIKNGKFVGDGVGFYGAGTMAGHRNHVHWAMSTPPSEASEKAKVDTLGGAAVDNRTPRQKNIDAIVAEGQRRNLSDRDIQIALMTAEQESGIRVLANPSDPASMNMPNEGVGYDHDSTGIFQQRNNGAWGTLEDRMDPTKSAGMFYDELEKIQGRDSMALTQVAQKVQRSAYPDAYAKHEGKASEELAASKARLESLSKSGGGSGEGQKVFVTNWPSGGGSYTRSAPSTDAIDDAKNAVEDAQKAAFIQDQSIAAMLARSAGRSDLIQVEKFADGGFHGLENHSAHIAPAGSWRVFGEPETGGEAYIPLASHKRARSTQILAETARRMGYSIGAGVNLVGSVLTGNGLDTSWGGPGLGDLGVDGGALKSTYATKVEQAMLQLIEAHTDLMDGIDKNVDGTLKQVAGDKASLRQQYARAMI